MSDSTSFNPPHVLEKQKQQLYQMIIEQFKEDGLNELASMVSNYINPIMVKNENTTTDIITTNTTNTDTDTTNDIKTMNTPHKRSFSEYQSSEINNKERDNEEKEINTNIDDIDEININKIPKIEFKSQPEYKHEQEHEHEEQEHEEQEQEQEPESESRRSLFNTLKLAHEIILKEEKKRKKKEHWRDIYNYALSHNGQFPPIRGRNLDPSSDLLSDGDHESVDSYHSDYYDSMDESKPIPDDDVVMIENNSEGKPAMSSQTSLQEIKEKEIDTLSPESNTISGSKSTATAAAAASSSSLLSSASAAEMKGVTNKSISPSIAKGTSQSPRPPNNDANNYNNNNTNNNNNNGTNINIPTKGTRVRPMPIKYESQFVGAHKSMVTGCTFSHDGMFVSIECADGSVKIYQVDKIHTADMVKKTQNTKRDHSRAIFSTLNTQKTVNELDFHPFTAVACVCHDDGDIAFWNFHQHPKQPAQVIKEYFAVKSVQFHPNGDYVLAGGAAPFVRLYDVKKKQGYIGSEQPEKHITQVKWSPSANIFACCGDSGDIRIFDGRLLKYVQKLPNAHKGEAIHSITFSKSSKYLLSSGRDSMVRLWDMRVGEQCMEYRGCSQEHVPSEAVFSYNDEQVICSSDITNRILIFDTNSGKLIGKCKDHKSPITAIASSPIDTCFMSGGLDCKSRFWDRVEAHTSNVYIRPPPVLT